MSGKIVKKCYSCSEVKFLEDYHFDRRRKDQRQARCKQCQNEEMLKRYKKDPDKKRDKNLKKLYGISLQDYNLLKESQNNRCKICERHEKEFYHKLAVDHCHKTGRIRGLLCTNCNIGLGNFNHSVDLLNRAREYLS